MSRTIPAPVVAALLVTSRELVTAIAAMTADRHDHVPSRIRHLAMELANVLDYADGLRGEP
jgi:hypothetical protein